MELGEVLRNTEELSNELTLFLRRLTATPAGRALRCSLNVQAMLTQEPGSEMLQDFCLWKGDLALRHAALVIQNQIP